MIQIFLDGQQLEVLDADVLLKFRNFRFAESIADQFSTSIELPKSDRNVALLDIYGVMERGQLFGSKIACSVAVNGLSADAYLTIDRISETIEATIYLSTFPCAILDKKVRDVIHDNPSTTLPWNGQTTIGGNANVDYRRYDNGLPPTGQWCNLHPSIRLSWLLSELGSRLGVTMPSVATDLVLIANKKQVSPYVTTWAGRFLRTDESGSQGVLLQCGDHICIDAEPRQAGAEGRVSSIVFNRRIEQVSLRLVVGNISPLDATFTVSLNGEDIYTHAVEGANYYESGIITIGGVDAEDKIEFDLGAGVESVLVLVTMAGYEVTEDDYGRELTYVAEVPFVRYGIPSQIHTSSNIPTYSYFGTMANLGEMTIRELLSSLCWALNRQIIRNGKVLSFSSSMVAKTIEAQVEEVAFTTDKIGRSNVVKWANESDEEAKVFMIPSEFLEAVKMLHKSAFAKLDPGVNAGQLNQYKLNDQGDGNFKVEYTDIEGIALGREVASPTARALYLIEPYDALSFCGVDELKKALEVTLTTYDDVSNCDIVYVDGHKAFVVEGTRDAETGLTELTTLYF